MYFSLRKQARIILENLPLDSVVNPDFAT